MEIVQILGWVFIGSIMIALSVVALTAAAAIVRSFWRS